MEGRDEYTWREHELVDRFGPLGLVVLGVVLIAFGLAGGHYGLVALGFAALLSGVVLPRVEGLLKAGPSGVEANLRGAGPRGRIRPRNLPPGTAAEVEIEAVDNDGKVVSSYTEPLRSNETLEFFGARLLETSRDLDDWWVTFRAPELSDGGWEALREAPDMAWLARSGASTGVGRIDPDNIPEPSSWHYRVIVKARDKEQAVAKVRGALEPHDIVHGWEAERTNLPPETPGP